MIPLGARISRLNALLSPGTTGCGNGCNSTIPVCRKWHANGSNDGLPSLRAQSITLIFPSAFLNNPASMFGHAFLRIDQKGQTEQTRILGAYDQLCGVRTLLTPESPYPIRGIFGGYSGYFSTYPYYLKVQEYRDFENRDDLGISPSILTEYQVTRLLLMHSWEMGMPPSTTSSVKENCSYHTLGASRVMPIPPLHLTRRVLLLDRSCRTQSG